MENRNYSQLELFSQQAAFDNSKPQLQRSSFLGYIRAYEKAVLIIICFITTAIISFSLGVEKGKRIVSSNMLLERARLPMPAQPVVSMPELKQEAGNSDKPVRIVKPKEEAQKNIKGYTIQVASYKTKEYAKREAESLKRRGLSTLFLNKGRYTVLCVGNFSNRNAAESLLSELKKQKRYAGCLIRRL